MNVLVLTTHINFGGIANYVLSLSRSLAESGVRVTVLSSGGDLEKEFKHSSVKHVRMDIKTKSELSPKIIRAVPAVLALTKERKIDIIHAHTRVTQVLSAAVSALGGPPYVTTCHGYFKRRLGRRLFGCWGERVIAISDQVRAHLEDDFGLRREQIELIYTGIDTDRFSRLLSVEEILRLRSRLNIGKGPVIGTIGRLSPVKGHQFFIKAFREVISRIPEARGIIIGDGPEKRFLLSLIDTCGLKDSFRIINPTPETELYYSLLDVFVFPSLKEGLGLSLLEAMASGSACVASDVGGIKNIIKNETSGLLVKPGDAGALAEAIVRLLVDASLQHTVCENAKRLVEKEFTLERMTRQIAELYRKVIKAHDNKS